MTEQDNMIEVVRDSVQTWQCDAMGHMNVQFYSARAASGLAVLGTALGLGPSYARAHGARLVAHDQHIRFLREQRPGAPYYIKAGIVDAHDEGFKIYQELVNTASGVVGATFTSDVGLYATQARDGNRPRVGLPEEAREKARAYLCHIPAHGQAKGLDLAAPQSPPALADAIAKNMPCIYQGEVLPDLGDIDGFLQTRAYMGMVSDGIPNLLVQTAGEDRSANDKVGGAALEYRFVYHAAPRIGDLITIRSGLKMIGTKTYNWCHWMFDVETGKAVATAEAVAVALDLVARKAIDIPPGVRGQLERNLIPGLTV